MAHASDTALAILKAVNEAHLAGRTPFVIILGDIMRDRLWKLGIGNWSEGSTSWSLFNVPVVEGLVPGWEVRLSPGAATTTV